MVSIFVVVLEVVEPMVVLDPGLHDYTLIPFCGGLEEFLDSRSDLLRQEVVEIPLLVQGGWKFPKVQVGMEGKDLTTSRDHG